MKILGTDCEVRTESSVDSVLLFLWVVIWVTGAVLAKGFWSTVFVIGTCGIWSLYLVIERVLQWFA